MLCLDSDGTKKRLLFLFILGSHNYAAMLCANGEELYCSTYSFLIEYLSSLFVIPLPIMHFLLDPETFSIPNDMPWASLQLPHSSILLPVNMLPFRSLSVVQTFVELPHLLQAEICFTIMGLSPLRILDCYFI